MTSRTTMNWTCIAVVSGIAACWPGWADAQETDPSAPEATSREVASHVEDMQASEVGAVEDHVLSPETRSESTDADRPKPFIINARADYQFDTDIDDAGEFNVTRVVGVGQDEQFRAALSLTWEPIPDMQVSVLGGAAFGGELRVEDEDGDRLVNEDYDPAPFVGAGMTWRL